MPRPRSKNRDLPPRMQKKHNVYYYTPYVGGKLKWIRLSDDFAEAKKLWAEYEEEQAQGEIIRGTFAELAQKYKKDVLPNKAKSTQEIQELQISKLINVFGNMRVKKIKPVHVARYLDVSKKKIAANREINLMSNIMAKAVRWGMCDANPCIGVERNKETPRDRYITDEELTTLRGLANPTLRCIIDLAYITGMRKQDILAIQKSNDGNCTAYLAEDGIYIRQKKTQKRQKFLINETLKKILETALEISNKESNYLFTNTKGNPFTKYGFRSAWDRLAKKAGVNDVHFHDIRAKAATDAKMKGLDYKKMLGHTSQKMSDRYVKLRITDIIEPLSF